MNRSLPVFLFATVLFMLGLTVFSVTGFLSLWYVYLAVLFIPTAVGCLILRLFGETGNPPRLLPDAKTAKRTLLGTFPVITACLLSSLLTIGIFALFGVEKNETELSGSLPWQIFYYALLPALGEEFLFRYFPLRYLAGSGKKVTLILSSLLFALAHGDRFSLLYAFVAGFLFMLADLSANSIFPSVFMHLCNNLLTVLLNPYVVGTVPMILYTSAAVCLSVVCCIILRKTDKTLPSDLRSVLSDERTGKEGL